MKFYIFFIIILFPAYLTADELNEETRAYLYYIPFHYQTNIRITKQLIQIVPSLTLSLDKNEIVKYKKEIDELMSINDKEKTDLDKWQIRCYFKIVKNNEVIFDFLLTNRPSEGTCVLNVDIKNSGEYVDFVYKIITENITKAIITDQLLLQEMQKCQVP
jgi:hypothetical protein